MESVIIPIVALLIPIIIVPTALGIKHAKFLREVEHAERMRAMELGRTLAEDESWSPASLAAMIGAGVPIAAMFVAFLAGKSSPMMANQIDAIWRTAGMVGLGGVAGGTILAAQQFAKRHAPAAPLRPEKPAFDHEAFEPVNHGS